MSHNEENPVGDTEDKEINLSDVRAEINIGFVPN